jgi:hypothetical protein
MLNRSSQPGAAQERQLGPGPPGGVVCGGAPTAKTQGSAAADTAVAVAVILCVY